MKPIRIIICLSLALMFCFGTLKAQKKFTLCIDAGHGGGDAGAIGDFSREKDINLRIALAFGKLVEERCKDVRVIYTRKTDVFIPLYKRPDIANKAKADLFISIHTNSVAKGSPRTARGVETYTNGIAQSKANMAVAQRENSVILLESDYKERYEGFNPNDPESYVIFELVQNQYMAKSVELARCIQQQLRVSGGRHDRGVQQTSLAVLRLATMPSVLVEVGFISTPQEEQYLNTDNGTQTTALCIFNGFVEYRNKHDRTAQKIKTADVKQETKQATPAATETKPAVTKADTAKQAPVAADTKPAATNQKATTSEPKADAISFRIQFLTSPTKLADSDARLKNIADIGFYREGNLYKYTSGCYATRNEASKHLSEVRKHFPDAFIVKFKGNERAAQ